MIATYRDDEIGSQHALRLVLGDVESARRIALPPLTEDGVRALAEGSDVDAHELFRQTGGNPFFVTEVLAAGGTGVPSSVRDAVLARAARLDPSARRILDAAAVAGLETEPSAPRRDRRRAPARPRRVPRRRCAPEHRGTASAFATSWPGGPSRMRSTRSGAPSSTPAPSHALSGSGDSARLAHHAEAAGDAPAVLEHARAAAERAAKRGAHREAAEQYARCLRFADDLPSEVIAELLERRSHECSVTLQVDEALLAGLAALDRYRELGDRLKEGELLSWSSRLLYWAARLEEAEDAAARGGRRPRGASAWTGAGAGVRAHGRTACYLARRRGRHRLGSARDRARRAARGGRDRRRGHDCDRGGRVDARERLGPSREGAHPRPRPTARTSRSPASTRLSSSTPSATRTGPPPTTGSRKGSRTRQSETSTTIESTSSPGEPMPRSSVAAGTMLQPTPGRRSTTRTQCCTERGHCSSWGT